MKKRNYIVTLMLVAASFSSCDYLDVVPDNMPTIEYAFRNKVEAEKYLYTCYSYLPNWVNVANNPGLNGGEEVWNCPYVLGNTQYYQMNIGNNISSPNFNYWDGANGGKKLYEALRNCNIFLENIELVKDLDTGQRAQWIAEVKFLKAYYHWFLAQLYGPIPLIKENISIEADEKDMRVYREPFDEVVNYIIQLLDEAKDNLPPKVENNIAEDGRITGAIAYAMKAKILVTAASPLFNGNSDYTNFKDSRGIQLISSEYDHQKWERARQACKEAIEFCDAELGGPGERALYTVNDYIAPSKMTAETRLLNALNKVMTEKWNKELIWGDSRNDIQGFERNKLITINQTTFRTAGANSQHGPTLRTVENYYTKNGLPIDEDATWDYNNRYKLTTIPEDHKSYAVVGEQTAYLHLNREPRFYANVGFDRGLLYLKGVDGLENDETKQHKIFSRNMEAAGKNGIMNYSGTGYFDKKTVSSECSVNNSGAWAGYRYPFPIMRLGDLYLLYAEAVNECLPNGNSLSDEISIEYVDKIRMRAGLKGIKETWDTYAMSQFKSKYETKAGMRDIIRRERLIELAFEGQTYYDKRRWKLMTTYMNEPVQGWYVEGIEAEEYYTVTTLFKPQFGAKDYLYPIRESDILGNPNLIQNPGW